MAEKTVDSYIANLNDWQADIVTEIRQIILETVPDADESIKWAQPVYEVNGPFAYIKAFKNSVNFGFWRGVDLEDPDGLLQGSGEKMRHFKLTNREQVNKPIFSNYIQQAVKLNLTKGDPTKG